MNYTFSSHRCMYVLRETIIPFVKSPFCSFFHVYCIYAAILCDMLSFSLVAAVDDYSSLQSLQEAALIGVDSLGFDLKVCSGTQVQTLRFAFNSQVLRFICILVCLVLYERTAMPKIRA